MSKSNLTYGLLFGLFGLLVGAGIGGKSTKIPTKLHPSIAPTEFQFSPPTGSYKLRVRDGGEPGGESRLWVVYVTTPDGFTRAYTCEPIE